MEPNMWKRKGKLSGEEQEEETVTPIEEGQSGDLQFV